MTNEVANKVPMNMAFHPASEIDQASRKSPGRLRDSKGARHRLELIPSRKRTRVMEFFVQGEPKGQPRPRAFAMKIGAGFQTRVYDPGTAEGWKSQIASHLRDKYPAFDQLTGPVSLRLEFALKRPKAHFLKSGIRSSAPLWHVQKPDADNYAKSCMDALTVLGVWEDDSQVASLTVSKKFTNNGQTGVQITIAALPTTP